jgi:hypothetical protein
MNSHSFQELRPIVGIVGLAIACPMLFAGVIPVPMRIVTAPLFFGALVAGTLLFYALRRSRLKSPLLVYSVAGIALGVFPSAFYFAIGALIDELFLPLPMLCLGASAGLVAGLALRRLDPYEQRD